MSGGFAVDLVELESFVDRVAAYDAAVGRILSGIDARVTGLASTWTGEAAASYEVAHARWRSDLAEMRAAAARLHAVAATAHGNYCAAVTANRAMWAR